LTIEYPTKLEEMKNLDSAAKIIQGSAIDAVVSIDQILSSGMLLD
jgi:hypothetical protein